MFENKGKISALWGAYQHTYGVNMNRVIGLSDWLAVLGFEANYFEVRKGIERREKRERRKKRKKTT